MEHRQSWGAFWLRLYSWEVWNHQMLVKDTACTYKKYLSTSHQEDSECHKMKIFTSLILRRKLCTALQWITNREKGTFYQPIDLCLKTGGPGDPIKLPWRARNLLRKLGHIPWYTTQSGYLTLPKKLLLWYKWDYCEWLVQGKRILSTYSTGSCALERQDHTSYWLMHHSLSVGISTSHHGHHTNFKSQPPLKKKKNLFVRNQKWAYRCKNMRLFQRY